MLRNLIFAVLATTAVVFSTATVTHAQITVREYAQKVTTPAKFVNAGGVLVSARHFKRNLVGRTLIGDDWIWIIRKNGNHWSRAIDGSWEMSDRHWEMQGNQFCRETQSSKWLCSDVYLLKGIYRFTEANGRFADWYVTLK